MMKAFLIAFLVLHGFVTSAQGLFLNDVKASGKPLMTDFDGSVAGSPYLHDQWGNGYVYLSENVKSESTMIRYDIYSGRIEIQDGTNIFGLDAAKIKGCKYSVIQGNESREVHIKNGFSQIKSATPLTYFEVIHEGKNIFLKRYSKKLGYDAASYGSANSKSFQDISEYYVIKESGEVIQFGETKKALLKAFPDQDKELSDFMKTNSIKVSSSKDMKILAQFLDALI